MIVVDASAMTELLLQTALGSRRHGCCATAMSSMPHTLLDVEVAQALRRLVRAGDVPADRALEALADLADFDLRRHSHIHFLGRAWDLRDHLTAYDAMYVALAEAIDARLVTCDRPRGATPGHAVRIEAIR